MRTVNAGENWEHLEDVKFGYLKFFSCSKGYGVGSRGLCRTEDGGRAWACKPMEGPTFDAAFFLNPEVGWIIGHVQDRGKTILEALRTGDGGLSWTRSPVGTIAGWYAIKDVFFANARMGWLVKLLQTSPGSVVLRTRDGGRSWEEQSLDVSTRSATRYVEQVRFISEKTGIALDSAQAGKDSRIYWTVDGGEHWQHEPFVGPVGSCQVVGERLLCSVGLDVVTITLEQQTASREAGRGAQSPSPSEKPTESVVPSGTSG